MATWLFRVGQSSFRHKWAVIATWVAALVIVGVSVSALSPTLDTNFELPGTDSGIATDQLEQYFPAVMEQQTRASTSVLVAANDGLAAHSGAIDALVADLRTIPGLADPGSIGNPVTISDQNPDLASQVLGDDGRVGLIQVNQNIEAMDLKPDDMHRLITILDAHRGGDLQVEATGSLMQVPEFGGTAELLGFAVAFVVLVVVFGALVAAFVPLVTAAVGVGLTVTALTLSAEFIPVNESATIIATMLGIAVSIDYALFIVSRYRSELHRGGSRENAIGRAVGTAGTAVVFAGLTVIIAVAALVVVGIPFISQMGFGAAIAVAVAVLSSITLIPALLGAVGRFVFLPRLPWIREATAGEGAPDGIGVRVGRSVVQRPWPFIAVGLVALAIAAIPMTRLELGLSFVTDNERPAFDLLERGFGEGINAPLLVVLHADGGSVTEPADAAVAYIQSLDNVANASELGWMGNGTATPNEGADTALVIVTPLSAPSAPETHDLMEAIRDFHPTVVDLGAEMHVGGQTAIMADISSKLGDALIPYLAVVVGLAFVIMIAVFRSLLVPLIATGGFLFSVLATFGATVAIFQEGALGLIANTQPIMSFLPIFLIGIVFGLAMDYQVFLVSRMREEYVHGMSARNAILAGYRHSAGVVTAAALIMISVFAAFMLSPDTISKMLGFSLAAAVFFDAFVIRMLVVPAVMSMLGDRAWYLPKWLDAIVPNLDVEGEAVRSIGTAPPPQVVVAPAT